MVVKIEVKIERQDNFKWYLPLTWVKTEWGGVHKSSDDDEHTNF